MKASMGNIETNFCLPLWKKGKASTIVMTNTGMGTFISGAVGWSFFETIALGLGLGG